MKTINTLICSCVVLLLSACGSDFDEDRLTSGSGTWYLRDIWESFIELNEYDEELEHSNYSRAKMGDLTYMFKSDGTFQVRSKLPTHFGGAVYETKKTGTWTYEKDHLYLDTEDGVWEYQVNYLRRKSLSLVYHDGDVEIREIFYKMD